MSLKVPRSDDRMGDELTKSSTLAIRFSHVHAHTVDKMACCSDVSTPMRKRRKNSSPLHHARSCFKKVNLYITQSISV